MPDDLLAAHGGALALDGARSQDLLQDRYGQVYLDSTWRRGFPGALNRSRPQYTWIVDTLAGWQWTEKEFNYGIDLGIGMELLGDDELAFTFGYQSAPQGGGGDAGGTLRGDLQHALRPLNAARIRNSTGGTQHAIHPLPGSRGRRPVHGGLLQLHQRKRYAAGARRAVGPGAAAQLLPGAADGERAEQILLSVLAEEGVRPRLYPAQPQGDLQLVDDRERQQRALDWARQQKLAYVVTGSVEEWQYKNGLDGEPAVGVSLQVLELASGGCSEHQRARAGWSRESLAGAAQKVLRELVGDLRLE